MEIKLDMEKAYGRLEWMFIKKCFKDLEILLWILALAMCYDYNFFGHHKW